MRFVMAFLAAWAAHGVAAQDCGPDAPCEIENGSYYLKLPEGEGPHPVMLWFHGANSNGSSIHRGGGLQKDFLDQGYALLAPNGQTREGRGPSRFFFPGRDGSGRDDVAFTFEVLAAAQQRGNLDTSRLYASGFSAGGSMVWLLACEAGDKLQGMVSVAGALRVPNATDCSGLEGLPVMQVHGWADNQVPLEGRAIRDWHQGSVWTALERARAANGCRSHPDEIEVGETYRTRTWEASCTGAPVRIDLHDGAHGLPQGWTTRARVFLEGGLAE
ncbi:prolyl oligopeptidase family serine peptidase [Sulfitobacter sp.]|uniref:alpha/beta hydrolase family esterase n=1 Tax=Sulfitobacter sp. TaxID=1903071 RepID=UPI00329A20D3